MSPWAVGGACRPSTIWRQVEKTTTGRFKSPSPPYTTGLPKTPEKEPRPILPSPAAPSASRACAFSSSRCAFKLASRGGARDAGVIALPHPPPLQWTMLNDGGAATSARVAVVASRASFFARCMHAHAPRPRLRLAQSPRSNRRMTADPTIQRVNIAGTSVRGRRHPPALGGWRACAATHTTEIPLKPDDRAFGERAPPRRRSNL